MRTRLHLVRETREEPACTTAIALRSTYGNQGSRQFFRFSDTSIKPALRPPYYVEGSDGELRPHGVYLSRSSSLTRTGHLGRFLQLFLPSRTLHKPLYRCEMQKADVLVFTHCNHLVTATPAPKYCTSIQHTPRIEVASLRGKRPNRHWRVSSHDSPSSDLQPLLQHCSTGLASAVCYTPCEAIPTPQLSQTLSIPLFVPSSRYRQHRLWLPLPSILPRRFLRTRFCLSLRSTSYFSTSSPISDTATGARHVLV